MTDNEFPAGPASTADLAGRGPAVLEHRALPMAVPVVAGLAGGSSGTCSESCRP